MTLQSINQASQLECAPHNLLVPLADRARGWLRSDQQRHVAPGAYIPIWWDLRWNADPDPIPPPNPDQHAHFTPTGDAEAEDNSLMQRLASTTTLQCRSLPHDPLISDVSVDPDETSFMQNGVESITPSDRTQGKFVVHIFARKTWHKAFDTESTEDLQAQIVDQWNLPTSGDLSVVALHPTTKSQKKT